MRTIWLVFIANFKRAYSNKKKFFINLLVPVAAIILAIVVNYVSSPSLNIGVNEKIKSKGGDRIVKMLKHTRGINAKVCHGELMKTEVILGKYDAVVTIKRKLGKNSFNNMSKYFEFYNVRDKKTNEDMKKLIKAYLVQNKTLNMERIVKDEQIGGLSKSERIIAFLATVLLITSVVNGAVIIRDREENTYYRYMYSPNSKFEYIFGNVIYNYIFSYIQLFIANSLMAIFGIYIGISFLKMLSYGLILTLVMTTFGTFIVCIFNKELYANMFSAAISLILSLVGGTFINYKIMPEGLRRISDVTPNRWIIKSVQYMQNGRFGSINPMMVLIAFSIMFSLAAVLVSKFHKVQFK
ncbi:ABC-2 type transport system permease protein [Clostridium acetobutylicum]|uniref:Predicted integral membrane protein n=1 Tax=Clostridium acetobutylicum (strain ATCC 824 / DSM 792 / JCM 1419 / IAM 19013 / LMG 5710 / NBRC 13948 / NRRL B-527 / VKM B-1787 / 2291 / W) TaxID=272562 RepID=Q97KT1_CLOAB|nr:MULTISPECIES: ABC transporter permease [Clostridium]AAK78811.1 Predicted integral membrane protein [Clostridium acetobutylicum ATCC 824]ADZ19885.1 integral membrane protein [Clostridium acetobutylicum EA 2018]AEI31466.1 integral membrane protein [Clostridium acetobutylicum DSM 1731]AWV80529.1 ABC transporter permease [Clostridium acetobutylicum]MBC2392719.1 ABC transporter permease [Clostridium acetobutylicum]